MTCFSYWVFHKDLYFRPFLSIRGWKIFPISVDQANSGRFSMLLKWFSISFHRCTIRPRGVWLDSDITWHSCSFLRIFTRSSMSSQNLWSAIFLGTWWWFDIFLPSAPPLTSRSFWTEWFCNSSLLCDKEWRKRYYVPHRVITERVSEYVPPFCFIRSSLRMASCFFAI